MKQHLAIVIVLLFIACNSKKEKEPQKLQFQKLPPKVAQTDTAKIYPMEKATEKFDTLIANKNINISIVRRDLDSYVLHDSWASDKKYTDKYRNAEIALTITQNEKVVLDTIFKKEQFAKSLGNDFLKIAIFHNYWFKNIDEKGIEFFGVITEPETDNTLDFNHFYNFKTKKLEFAIAKEEEE
jgi:hypothetical protein